jgi:hypothetical protein
LKIIPFYSIEHRCNAEIGREPYLYFYLGSILQIYTVKGAASGSKEQFLTIIQFPASRALQYCV